MAKRHAHRLSQLWQFPLLVTSLGLFGFAAYRFIDPQPGASIAQRIAGAEDHLKNHRYEACVEEANKILEVQHLKKEDDAHLHLLLAETIEAAQKERRLNLATNHQRIVAQTELALAEGATLNSDAYRRLGESQEALGQTTQALDAYRKAMALDVKRALPLQRKVIELQLLDEDAAPAEASIQEYLKNAGLSDSERAWAMGQRAQVMIKRGHYSDARRTLENALQFDKDPTSIGVSQYWLGVCLKHVGESAEAERVLRAARDQLKVSHPLDAEAAYLLGTLRQAAKDPREAIAFYEAVLMSHPESRPEPLARLGRALSRVMIGDDDAAMTDLHEVVKELGAPKVPADFPQEVVKGLRQASTALAAKGDHRSAIEVMELEQILTPEPPAEFYGRLARLYERRADQLENAEIASAAPIASKTAVEKLKREEEIRRLRTSAGDSYIALSRALTVSDDRGQGEAMWKAVDLYDRAGALPQAVAALELYVAERPGDGQTPSALLRLGQAYQALGQFDKAIRAFRQNQFLYPQSLAASKSGVPLAQAYIAKGPEFYPQAEKVLLGVLENNSIITPEAEEFRLSLFELAQLYYRTGRYEDAVARLEETTERYPKDPRTAQLLFLMADSYRKSATLLAAAPAAAAPAAPTSLADASAPPAADPQAAAATQAERALARRDRLIKARALFDRVVERFRQEPPTRDIDRLYQKLSHFYRADCMYDLGEYEEAIRLYDAATLRYQDDPSSVAAYVQIVNAYCALNRKDDAKTANERAKWLLRRMPASAFEEAKYSMPKQYWDDWIRQSNESGMYSRDARRGALSDAR